MDSKALTTTTQAGMLARIESARFPQQLTPQEKERLALAARTYGLDPLMGELTIYQGQPYVGIDGRRRKAQETKLFDGVHTRPATKAEKEEWGYPVEDYFFHADIYVKGASHPFEGWGRVSQVEIGRLIERAKANKKDPYSIPVVKDPQGMAEKRAEAKGLRKAFNIPLPSAEAIEEEDGELPNPPKITVDGGPEKSVNKETGEVSEGEFVDPDDLLAEADAQKQATKAAQVPNPTSQAVQAPPASSTGKQEPLMSTDSRCFPTQVTAIEKMFLGDMGLTCQLKYQCKPMDMSHKQAAEWIQELDKEARKAKAK